MERLDSMKGFWHNICEQIKATIWRPCALTMATHGCESLSISQLLKKKNIAFEL